MVKQTELYRAIKSIDIEKLTEDNKEELLRIFQVTKDHGIRNQISLIFSDLHYDKAAPFIIKKINEKQLYNYNGTLVYSLDNLDAKRYFFDIIRIICEQDYEARCMAYPIIEKYASSVSKSNIKRSLKKLKDHQIEEEKVTTDHNYKNSTLNFIEATIDLLSASTD